MVPNDAGKGSAATLTESERHAAREPPRCARRSFTKLYALKEKAS